MEVKAGHYLILCEFGCFWVCEGGCELFFFCGKTTFDRQLLVASLYDRDDTSNYHRHLVYLGACKAVLRSMHLVKS